MTPPPPESAVLDSPTTGTTPRTGPKPLFEESPKALWEQIALYLFVIVPFLGLVAAVPVAWGWGLSWHDVVIGLVFYGFSGLGISVGFHRYCTHGDRKSTRLNSSHMSISYAVFCLKNKT